MSVVYYNFRHYNPINGQWLSRDPLGEAGGMNLYLHCLNNAISFNDHLGRVLPVLVYAGVTITLCDAAEVASILAATFCISNPECIKFMTDLANQLISTVSTMIETLQCIRCHFDNHGPHHSFIMPRWGCPPWKKCWMNHFQINCWWEGVSGSNFLEIRIPHGPCYKYRNANPDTTH